MSNLPDILKKDMFIQAGLNPQEVELACRWHLSLDPAFLERPRVLYMRGISCEEINRKYPEYTLPCLLSARATFKWDDIRRVEANKRASSSLLEAGYAQPDGLSFLNKVISIINLKYEKSMMDYLTDPERAPYPEISKADFERLENATALSREILGLSSKAKETGGANIGGPLINIVIKDKTAHVIEVDGEEVGARLIRQMEEDIAKKAALKKD